MCGMFGGVRCLRVKGSSSWGIGREVWDVRGVRC